jgi:PAS domain S-box-containing protein
MNQASLVNLALMAIAAVAVMMLIFAVLRLSSAAKGARQRLRDSGSEAALLSVALQDAVSKLKAQEHAMSIRAITSEQLNGQIVESLAAGLLVVDRDGRVEILNPAGHRMLGAPGDVVGRDYRAFLADVPELQELIARCLATAAPVPRRRIPCSRGEVTQLAVTVSPLSADGSSQGAICLFSDLTQMLELEDQLRLKEALARVGELTAGIAHEFRNGLATIHGYSRLLRPEDLPATYRPYVAGIRQETEALGHVVTNFLNFARPEQVVFLPVDLEAVIHRAADELAHELPAQTVVEVSGEFGHIEGDEVLLRQVFGNLIRNAAEACQTAGRGAANRDPRAGRRAHVPHHRGRQRDGRARAGPHQDLPAVLHHPLARHRPGPVHRAEAGGHAQRARHCGRLAARRRLVPDRVPAARRRRGNRHHHRRRNRLIPRT